MLFSLISNMDSFCYRVVVGFSEGLFIRGLAVCFSRARDRGVNDCLMKEGNPFGPFWDELGVALTGQSSPVLVTMSTTNGLEICGIKSKYNYT